MSRGSKFVLVIVTGVICFSIGKCMAKGTLLPNHKVSAPNVMSQSSSHSTDAQKAYSFLSNKYSENIAHILNMHNQSNIKCYREQLEQFGTISKEIEGKDQPIIENIRSACRSKGKKLNGMSEMLFVRETFAPNSSTSAEIFGRLNKENSIDDRVVVSNAYSYAELLTNEWKNLICHIAGKYSNFNDRDGIGRLAVLTLYKAGVDKNKYRPLLEAWASNDCDKKALVTLFFDKDKQTGESVPVKVSANITLMNKLVDPKYPPEIRSTCANYAAEIGKIRQAESICLELLDIKYKGFDNLNGIVPEDDSSLARARGEALYLLFYKVKTEIAFKKIYDLSRLPWTQFSRKLEDEPRLDCVRYDAYVLGRMEINTARGFISEVAGYEE